MGHTNNSRFLTFCESSRIDYWEAATDLFAAAVLPGLLLSTIFTAWCLVRCWLNPACAGSN